MKNKKVKIIIFFWALFLAASSAQDFYVSDSIIQVCRHAYEQDSFLFEERFDRFMKAQTKEELEDASSKLDRFPFKKWIRMHSDEIVKKLNVQYKRCGECRNLLSLINNLPDSIRNDILAENNNSRKARLGDSLAIQYYIDKYTELKKMDGNDYDPQGLTYWLKYLLSFDSNLALDVVFGDIQSTRIIRQCDTPEEPNGCFIIHYTYLYSIVNALKEIHRNEPILRHTYIFRQILDPRKYTQRNPYLPEYYKLLEEFILREYGYRVKINVPYLRAFEN